MYSRVISTGKLLEARHCTVFPKWRMTQLGAHAPRAAALLAYTSIRPHDMAKAKVQISLGGILRAIEKWTYVKLPDV